MFNWTSKTNQFGHEELAMLEVLSAEELIPALLSSIPVVVLRALAEIMLNGDTDKLDAMLANPQINALWQQYAGDSEADDRDDEYARQLKERLPQ